MKPLGQDPEIPVDDTHTHVVVVVVIVVVVVTWLQVSTGLGNWLVLIRVGGYGVFILDLASGL